MTGIPKCAQPIKLRGIKRRQIPNPIDLNRKENAYSELAVNQTHTDYLYEHLIEVKDSERPVKWEFRQTL